MLRTNIVATIGVSSIGFLITFSCQLVISYHFGTSIELDAYWAAFTVMNFLAFPLTPLRDALIPEVHSRIRDGAQAASSYFSQGMTLIIAISVLGALLGGGFAESLTVLSVSEKQPQVRSLAVELLYWLLPVLALMAVSETLNAILTSYHRVIFQAFARLIGAVTTLVVLWLFVEKLQSRVLPMSMIAAQIVIAFLQIIVLRREGLRYRLVWPKNLGKRFRSVSTALLVTYAASQAYPVFEKHVLTSLSAGLVSSFQYSVALTNVLVTLVGISLTNVFWPRFLDHASINDDRRLYVDASIAIRLILLVMGWLSSLVWVNASVLVELVYARGAFDSAAVAKTADSLRLAVFASVPISVSLLMGRALVSLGAARSVMVVGIVTTSMGCMVLILGRELESPTVALSHWFVANCVGMIAYMLFLAKHCRLSLNQYARALWWLFRWGLILAMCSYLIQSYAINNTDFSDKLIDAIVKIVCYSSIFFVLAWTTGLFRGLSEVCRK